jgi:hypothetical protein
MTKDEIIQRIKQELDDQGIFFTDADIYDSLEDGYDLIALLTGCITKVTTHAFTAGKVYYNLLTNIPDFYRPLAIYDPNQRQFLEPISLIKLETFEEKWDTVIGTPQYFIPFPTHTVAFYPHYNSAPSQNFRVFYEASAPEIADVSTFSIPVQAQKVLIDYTVSDLFDQSLEINKSQKVWNDFLENLERVRVAVQNVAIRDRIDQMAALHYGTLDR